MRRAVTYGVPVTGGPRGAGGVQPEHVRPPTTPWAQQLEIWITPWGFLKGAAANNATVQSQTLDGGELNVVTWMSPQ